MDVTAVAAAVTTFDADASLLDAAARSAGAIALSYFRAGAATAAGVSHKDGGSPVTEADLAADKHLRRVLLDARLDYGWLSEETLDNPDRLGRKRCFVVDPIDGTRAFIAGRSDWTISLAVVEDGRPVAAVLYAPVPDLLLKAVPGAAFVNGAPLRISTSPPSGSVRVAGPKPLVEELQRRHGLDWTRVPHVISLAYRLALVALGDVDIGLASSRSHDWDIAAADLILRGAGATLIEDGVGVPTYNRADLRHGSLLAVSAAEAVAVSSLLFNRRT
jgi:myo-inositol-1(or 4)-monophosphatase